MTVRRQSKYKSSHGTDLIYVAYSSNKKRSPSVFDKVPNDNQVSPTRSDRDRKCIFPERKNDQGSDSFDITKLPTVQ